MKIKPQVAIVVTLSLFIVGIGMTSWLGLWHTQNTKIPARMNQPEYAEQYDPGDIRGSYTFAEISRLYQIPIGDLTAAFGVAERDAATFKCKDLETVFAESEYEIGTGTVRMFVAYYLGLPYELSEDAYLTETAGHILEVSGKPTDDQLAYVKEHLIPDPVT